MLKTLSSPSDCNLHAVSGV